MLICKKKAINRSLDSGLWGKKYKRRERYPFSTLRSIKFDTISGVEMDKIMRMRTIKPRKPQLKRNYAND